MVLFSFTFFTGTMFAGGKIGVAFNIVDMLWVAIIGNVLLATYAAALALNAARSGRIAVSASFISFLSGNGLMIISGAYCAIVDQQADIVAVMMLQGLSIAAVIMLCLNLWTIQGPTIYNVSAAACYLLRSERRRTLTLVGAAIGVVLAIGGMYEMLIPFLILLGSIIPPMGGVIMADYVFRYRGQYPSIQSTTLPRFNYIGLSAYAIGAVLAYLSPWIAPLVGIAASAGSYVLLSVLAKRVAPTMALSGE